MSTDPDRRTHFFIRPNVVERTFSRVFGFLVGTFGLGLSHHYLLEVRGRRSGRLYSTPVNLLEQAGRRFLISPRGETQWVRNARVAGAVTLVQRGRRQAFRLQPVPDEEKPELLKQYLERFRIYVQRCFPVTAGSPAEEFVPIAHRYPVFELIAFTDADRDATGQARIGVPPFNCCVDRHP